MKNLAFRKRLCFALAGIRVGMGEKSFRSQLACGVLAILALIIVRPALIWWALVGAMTALVLAAELFNAALERLCDHLHPNEHPSIMAVKDLAAGAVLALSIGALWVALLMVLSVFQNG